MVAMTARAYAGGIALLLQKAENLASDTLKVTLHTATYTPNYDTDSHQSDLSNELSTGSGYTAGGLTVSGQSVTKVAANSWAQVAATSTAYTVGQIVRPSSGNGYVYACAVAGTSGGSAPTWPTVLNTTVTDGGVTWTCIGRGAVVFTCTSPAWAVFSAGPFTYAVMADTTPGSSATNPLILAWAFGSPATGGGGTYTITCDSSGAVCLPY